MDQIELKFLGRKDFSEIWDYQRSLLKDRQNNIITDTLLLVEHDPVYTAGKSYNKENILNNFSKGNLSRVPFVNIDRGGDVTFHGPGQLVGYPVLYLGNYYFDLHKYLRDLEEVIILTLAELEIIADRKDGFTGVWVDSEKIASIGVKVSKWYTMHGFALNVNTDLSYYDEITACGIKNIIMTSISKILGKEIDLNEVAERTGKNFRKLFYERSKEMSKT